MNRLRQFVALAMIVALLHLVLGDVARATTKLQPTPDRVKQQVNLLGAGARIKVQLSDGTKLNGIIQTIEEANFVIAGDANSRVSVAYDQVTRLRFAKQTYKAKDSLDAEEARRVVVGLGIGKHIMVQTTEGQEYHGKIQALAGEDFTMLPDGQATPVQIAYADVRATGPNMSKGTKILIVVAVVVVVCVAAVVATKPWRSE